MSTTTAPPANANSPTVAGVLATVKKTTPEPALDLSKELFLFHSLTAEYKRNAQLSGQVFNRSLAVYEGIGKIMDKLLTSSDVDFDSFDRYSQAVPILERVLLELFIKSPEKDRGHLPPVDNIGDAIMFYHLWKEDRDILIRIFKDLRGDQLSNLSDATKETLHASYLNEAMSDDLQALAALGATISAKGPKNRLRDNDVDRDGKATPVAHMRVFMREIVDILALKPPNETISSVVVRAFILFYIPFTYLDPATVAKRDQNVQSHLRRKVIWSSMLGIATPLKKLVETGGDPQSLIEIEHLLDAFVELLAKIVPADVDNMHLILDLLKSTVKVRSPFHERIVALARILYHFETHSMQTDPASNNRRELGSVIETALEVFGDTAKAVNNVTTIVMETAEYTDADKKVLELVESVRKCGEILNLSNEWGDHEAKYKAGVDIDTKHHKLMKARFMDYKPGTILSY